MSGIADVCAAIASSCCASSLDHFSSRALFLSAYSSCCDFEGKQDHTANPKYTTNILKAMQVAANADLAWVQ